MVTFCTDSYSVSVPPCVTIVAQKKPQSIYQSASGRLHLNTLDLTKLEWDDCCLSIVWEPVRETSSHTTHQETLIHSHPQSYQLAETTVV